jgi:hypothetical protein
MIAASQDHIELLTGEGQLLLAEALMDKVYGFLSS